MKSHVLPFIGFSFAVLVIGRSFALSTHVVPPAQAEDTPAPVVPVTTAQTMIDGPTTDGDKLCLKGDVLNVLQNDLAALELRKSEITTRETALKAIEKKLEGQMAAVETANATLEQRIEQLKAVADEDLTHLVGMYQIMKPKEAAEIFNAMDPAFAAGFLREINSDKAGLIMANMDTRKSYSISVIIAGRNAKYR